MDFDVLIIGGGAAGLSCGLVIGSGLDKAFAENKKAGIIVHQRSSHLQSALLQNVLGFAPGTKGMDVLRDGIKHLSDLYPKMQQISGEMGKEIIEIDGGYQVLTNKDQYSSKEVVIAVGYISPFRISGLEEYLIPHSKAKISKKQNSAKE